MKTLVEFEAGPLSLRNWGEVNSADLTQPKANANTQRPTLSLLSGTTRDFSHLFVDFSPTPHHIFKSLNV
jgi:hypothetical protein